MWRPPYVSETWSIGAHERGHLNSFSTRTLCRIIGYRRDIQWCSGNGNMSKTNIIDENVKLSFIEIAHRLLQLVKYRMIFQNNLLGGISDVTWVMITLLLLLSHRKIPQYNLL